MSVNTALNKHSEIYSPMFWNSDIQIFDGTYNPNADESSTYDYQNWFPRDLDLKLALVFHGFSYANLQPGRSSDYFSRAMKSDTPVVIFSRNTLENFKSSYKTYQSLVETRRLLAYKNIATGTYVNLKPLSPTEYLKEYNYIFDYEAQIKNISNFTSNLSIQKFEGLEKDKFWSTMELLYELSGVRDKNKYRPEHFKENSSFMFTACAIFSIKNRFYVDAKYPITIGIFPSNSDALARYSFETFLPDKKGLLPTEYSFYASSPSWFTSPLKSRDAIINTEDKQNILEQSSEEFKNLLSQIDEFHFDSNFNQVERILSDRWESFSKKYHLD